MRPGLISFLLLALVANTSAETGVHPVTVADFVWSEENSEGSGLYYSSYSGAGWGDPQQLHFDKRLNILPAIASKNNGDLVVAWSALYPDRIRLKIMRRANGEWSPPKVLFESRAINLAPVVVADSMNSFWVFWSSNDGDDDDIMVSRSAAGGWSDPVLVHPENQFPDGLPEAGFDDSGNIWVEWQSLRNGVLEKPVRMFRINESGKLTTADIESIRSDSMNDFQLDPPVFFQSKSRATMYLPEDRKLPSRLFKGNLLP